MTMWSIAAALACIKTASLFAYIRSKRVKDSIGPLKGNNGAVISNNKEMAESLN